MRTNGAVEPGDFEGDWQLARRIEQAGGPRAVFAGHARWTRGADGLDYFEDGELQIAERPPMRATRRYRWDDDLRVFFDDGRFFHAVPPHGGTATHFCAPDTYVAIYDFTGWPRFSVEWRVKGPRKDYRMISDYRRGD